jgi:hypothetical protein
MATLRRSIILSQIDNDFFFISFSKIYLVLLLYRYLRLLIAEPTPQKPIDIRHIRLSLFSKNKFIKGCE